jgi:hypothetical protein
MPHVSARSSQTSHAQTAGMAQAKASANLFEFGAMLRDVPRRQ